MLLSGRPELICGLNLFTLKRKIQTHNSHYFFSIKSVTFPCTTCLPSHPIHSYSSYDQPNEMNLLYSSLSYHLIFHSLPKKISRNLFLSLFKDLNAINTHNTKTTSSTCFFNILTNTSNLLNAFSGKVQGRKTNITQSNSKNNVVPRFLVLCPSVIPHVFQKNF